MRYPIRAVHFQLTGRCNLACRFCGQNKGMLASHGGELPVEFWLRCAGETEVDSAITFWGGEPLLYPGFEELAAHLSGSSHSLEVVTNGTLIARHAKTLCRDFDRIYVSVDGPRELHDAVRGEGVFDRVRAALPLLDGRRGELIFLTTISDANVEYMAELPDQIAELKPDRMILQQLMYLSGREIEQYRDYSRTHFHCDYPELEAWRRDDDSDYIANWRKGVRAIAGKRFPFNVTAIGHCYPECASDSPCQAPESRLHIRHDGETGFCTDYFGFSLGNAQDASLRELIDGERADLWRRAIAANALPVCNHCAWRLQPFSR